MSLLTETYSLKLSKKDRALLERIAAQEERSPADILRSFIRREAANRKLKDMPAQPQV